MRKPNIVEAIFESVLWSSRLITIIVVIFSVAGAVGMFGLGSAEIYHAIKQVMEFPDDKIAMNNILISIIGAIDFYLIGIVLLLFSFGVYELFVSKIDEARLHESGGILDIRSLDDLKNKILKVIVMVLIVGFAKAVLAMNFTGALEVLFFSLSILGVAASAYLIRNDPRE